MKKYTCIAILCFATHLSVCSENDPQKIGTINLYYVCSQTNTNNAPQHLVNVPTLPKTHCRNSLLQQLRSLSWQHKGKVIMGSMIGSYTGIVGKLILTVQSQYKQPSWAYWKQEIPLDVLVQMAQDVVMEELITTICQNQNNTTQPTPQLSMLYKALQEINKELLALHNSVRFYRFVEYTPLTKIVPYNNTDLIDALEKINRLTYLKNLLENLNIVPSTPACAA